MRLLPRLLVAWLLAAIVLAPAAASAQPPASPSPPLDVDPPQPHRTHPLRLELLGGAGLGRVALSTRETINAFGPAASLRLSYRFGFGASIGLRYDHFFGSSSEYLYDSVGNFAYSARVSSATVDLGYELFLPHAFVRPHVALGGAWVRRDVDCSIAEGAYGASGQRLCDLAQDAERSNQDLRFAIVPGLTMAVRFGAFHAMLEPRYYVRSEADGYALMAGAGWAF